MQAPGIVEALDVGKEIPARFVPRGVDAVMDALNFERVEEALHRRVVEAIALPAHGGRYLRGGKGLAILVSCVLNAAIRMLDQPRRRALASDGHVECFECDRG